MSYQTQPALGFRKITSFPHVEDIRRVWCASGTLVIKNDNGTSVTIAEAELPAVNNQAIYISEITSSSLGAVFISG